MPGTLEIRLGFTRPLDAGRVTAFHINTNDVSRVIIHRVPKTTMTMLHTSLMDVWKKADRSWLPTVLFLGH